MRDHRWVQEGLVAVVVLVVAALMGCILGHHACLDAGIVEHGSEHGRGA